MNRFILNKWYYQHFSLSFSWNLHNRIVYVLYTQLFLLTKFGSIQEWCWFSLSISANQMKNFLRRKWPGKVNITNGQPNPIVIVWQLADVAAIRDLPSIDIMKELIPIKWRLEKHRRSKKKDAQTFNLAQKSCQG